MDVWFSIFWGLIYYLSGFFVFYLIIYKVLPSFKEMIYGQGMRSGEKKRYYFLFALVSSLAFIGYLTWILTNGGAVSIALTGSIVATIVVVLVPTIKDIAKGDYFKTLRLFAGARPGDIFLFVVQWSKYSFFAEFDYVNFATTTLRDIFNGSEITILNRDLGKYQIANLTKGATEDFIVRDEKGKIILKIMNGYCFNVDFFLKHDINMKEIEDILINNVAKVKTLNTETNEIKEGIDEEIIGFLDGDPDELKPTVSWSFYPGFIKATLMFRCENFYEGIKRVKNIIPQRIYPLLKEKGVLIDKPMPVPKDFIPELGVNHG